MKKDSRHKRIAQRELAACEEQECEKFVRSRLTPELTANARKAIEAFNNEDRGNPVRKSR